MSNDGYVAVANLGDIADDEGKCVEVGCARVALFKYEGNVYALNDVCPHQGAPLHEGFFDDGIVTCPLHAWDFDVKTGRVRGGSEFARSYPVRITGDVVEVLVE